MGVKTSPKPEILCFGEALWDCLPRGLFVGGAPLNAALHLRRFGHRVSLVSALGKDFTGDELLRRIRSAGVDDSFIARRARLPTGTVRLSLDSSGDATFTIATPAAWDRIDVSDSLIQRAAAASCLIHGSLALRGGFNRRGLCRLKKVSGLCRIFDVNLRSPFDHPEVIHEWARGAGLVKMNEEELHRLLPGGKGKRSLQKAVRLLAEEWETPAVCVTLGKAGACLLEHGNWFREKGRKIKVRDTVGAGDAFLAALSHHLFMRKDPPEEALAKACRLGEFVASADGAVPEFDPGRF